MGRDINDCYSHLCHPTYLLFAIRACVIILTKVYRWVSMVCNGYGGEQQRYAVSSVLGSLTLGARTPLAGARSSTRPIGWELFIVLI